MKQQESDLTKRRRWVPLRGMAGSLDADWPSASSREESSRYVRDGELDWLIIGGGIQGTYLSHFLIRSLGFARDRVRVLDLHERPLAGWVRNTENVGMEYLRSAAVHHLDLPSLSLKRFAVSEGSTLAKTKRSPFIAPYGRPLLSLFNRHAQRVIESNGLENLRIWGRVTQLRPLEGGYEVEYLALDGRSPGGERTVVSSRRVLLAIGMDDATHWPAWAERLRAAGAHVHHVLDPDFRRGELESWRRALVYGGGLSGAQVSAALTACSPGSVTLLCGHQMEVHLFDSEPSWQGANFMAAFAAERDPAVRREIITRERHRGSLTPEADEELALLRKRGELRVATVDPSTISARAAEGCGIRIDAGGERFEGDLLILATGYRTRRPGGEWIEHAVDTMGLPCAQCGFPIVTPSLEWRRGLFVSGPLAELELGPVARNISGAHRAAARLEYFV